MMPSTDLFTTGVSLAEIGRKDVGRVCPWITDEGGVGGRCV